MNLEFVRRIEAATTNLIALERPEVEVRRLAQKQAWVLEDAKSVRHLLWYDVKVHYLCAMLEQATPGKAIRIGKPGAVTVKIPHQVIRESLLCSTETRRLRIASSAIWRRGYAGREQIYVMDDKQCRIVLRDVVPFVVGYFLWRGGG
ncbi:MAG: hypothetical protein QM708_16285 [Propioniciclava sp.]|uniref:hypothetical protein n=1 Tax=Propioniciclava sp. TaxID=2038686 RepID=UPI0039E420E0